MENQKEFDDLAKKVDSLLRIQKNLVREFKDNCHNPSPQLITSIQNLSAELKVVQDRLSKVKVDEGVPKPSLENTGKVDTDFTGKVEADFKLKGDFTHQVSNLSAMAEGYGRSKTKTDFYMIDGADILGEVQTHQRYSMFLEYQEGKPFNIDEKFQVIRVTVTECVQFILRYSHYYNNSSKLSLDVLNSGMIIINGSNYGLISKLNSSRGCCLQLLSTNSSDFLFAVLPSFDYGCILFDRGKDLDILRSVYKLVLHKGYKSDSWFTNSVVTVWAKDEDSFYASKLYDKRLQQDSILWIEFMLTRETDYWVAQKMADQWLVGTTSFTSDLVEAHDCSATENTNSSQKILNNRSMSDGDIEYTFHRILDRGIMDHLLVHMWETSGKYFCESLILARMLFDRGKLFEDTKRYSYCNRSSSDCSFCILNSGLIVLNGLNLMLQLNETFVYELIMELGYCLDHMFTNSNAIEFVKNGDKLVTSKLLEEIPKKDNDLCTVLRLHVTHLSLNLGNGLYGKIKPIRGNYMCYYYCEVLMLFKTMENEKMMHDNMVRRVNKATSCGGFFTGQPNYFQTLYVLSGKKFSHKWLGFLTSEVDFVRLHVCSLSYTFMVIPVAIENYVKLLRVSFFLPSSFHIFLLNDDQNTREVIRLKRDYRGVECGVRKVEIREMLANNSIGKTSGHEWLEEKLKEVVLGIFIEAEYASQWFPFMVTLIGSLIKDRRTICREDFIIGLQLKDWLTNNRGALCDGSIQVEKQEVISILNYFVCGILGLVVSRQYFSYHNQVLCRTGIYEWRVGIILSRSIEANGSVCGDDRLNELFTRVHIIVMVDMSWSSSDFVENYSKTVYFWTNKNNLTERCRPWPHNSTLARACRLLRSHWWQIVFFTIMECSTHTSSSPHNSVKYHGTRVSIYKFEEYREMDKRQHNLGPAGVFVKFFILLAAEYFLEDFHQLLTQLKICSTNGTTMDRKVEAVKSTMSASAISTIGGSTRNMISWMPFIPTSLIAAAHLITWYANCRDKSKNTVKSWHQICSCICEALIREGMKNYLHPSAGSGDIFLMFGCAYTIDNNVIKTYQTVGSGPTY